MNRIFYGWWIVVVSMICLMLSAGPVVMVSFGVFMKPFAEEFGWGRAEISLAFSSLMVGLSVSLIIAGRLTDRFGSRPVMFFSVLLFGLGLISFNFLTANLWHLYAQYFVIGLVAGAVSPMPYCRVIVQWFDRYRGLALGLATAGIGFGMFLIPSLSQWLIDQFGWRRTFVILGALVLVVTTPLIALFIRDQPASMGLAADGAPAGKLGHGPTVFPPGLTAREGIASREFWIIFTVFLMVSTGITGVTIHMVPLATDRGVSAPLAAAAVSVFGLSTVVGRILAGYMLDRMFAPNVTALAFCAVAVGVAFFWWGALGALVFLGAGLVGFGWGAENDLLPYLVSRYLGMRAFGELYAYAILSFSMGSVIGPYVMGLCFDWRGSYDVALGGSLVLILAGVALVLRLGRYPNQHLQVAVGS